MDHKMNMLAVAVATLMPMIVGFIYYHPKVAGGMWMKANGFTLDSIGNGPKPILYVGALVLAFSWLCFVMAMSPAPTNGQPKMAIVM